MTLQSFKARVVLEATLLAIFGQPTNLSEVIYNVPEWHLKWLEGLDGKYDA